MPTLSAFQVAEAIIKNNPTWSGLTNLDPVRAVAVALAESDGKTDAVNTNRDGSHDLGLFQINDKAHPEVLNINWRDPSANITLAYTIQKKDGWRPWDSSRLRQIAFMPVASTAMAVASAEPSLAKKQTIDSTKDLVSRTPVGNTAETFADAWSKLSSGRFWARLGEIALGAVLLIVAANVLAKPVTEPVVKTAIKAGKLAAT